MQQTLHNLSAVFSEKRQQYVYEIRRQYLHDKPSLEHPHAIVKKQANGSKALSTDPIPLFYEVLGSLSQNVKMEASAYKLIQYRMAPSFNKYCEKGWWRVFDNIKFESLNGEYASYETQEEEYNMGLFCVFKNGTNKKKVIGKYILNSKIRFAEGNEEIRDMRWQSPMQLQHKLKNIISSVHYSRRTSTLFHIQMILSHKYILLVYNRQRLIFNAMQVYSEDEDRWKSQLNFLNHNNTQRFKYPLTYYSQIYDHYRTIKASTSIPFHNIIKIIKYLLIQNIPLSQLNLLQNYQLQQMSATIREQQLIEDPISNVVIFYFLLGMPGLGKTQILTRIKLKLQSFNCSSLFVSQANSHQHFDHDQLAHFLKSEHIFNKQRFSYVLLDLSFSPDLVHHLLSFIETHLPKTVHYQFYLISPSLSSQHYFKEQHLISNISYLFSIQMIIASLLNVQSRKKHPSLNGNGVDSLGKMLHFISSIYANIDIESLANKAKGNVEIIEYEPFAIIDWSQMSQFEIQEIEDELRVLLQLSFKEVYEKDALMYYFLQNIQRISYSITAQPIADHILSQTFKPLPYFDFLS